MKPFVFLPWQRIAQRLIISGVLVFGVIAAMTAFSAVVSYNMDEFIHYDVLACMLYPGNSLAGQCDPFSLNFLNTGLILPLRAFGYSGSFPALYYLPVHLLWNSPVVARSLNVGMLMLGAWIAARSLRVPKWPVVIGALATFPYFFQHAVDTGPVSFQILSVILISALLERWLQTLHARYIAAITVILFCAFWTKFTEVWFVPGFAMLFALSVWRHRDFLLQRGHPRKMAVQSLGAIACFAILVGSLLLSTDPLDPAVKPYLLALTDGNDVFTIGELLRGQWLDTTVVFRLLHPLEATHRVYQVADVPALSLLYAVLAYAAIPLILAAIYAAAPRRNGHIVLRPVVLYVAFLTTVIMIARSKNAGAMHHAILSYPFLLLAAVATWRALLDAKLLRSIPLGLPMVAHLTAALFLIVNIGFFLRFPSQTNHPHDEPSKQLAHTILNTGDVPWSTMVVAADWGMYYYTGLFGSPQKSVVFEWGIADEERMLDLQHIAHRNGRTLAFLVNTKDSTSDIDHARRLLGLRDCAAMPRDGAWRIYAEPNPAMRKVCAEFAKRKAKTSMAKSAVLRAELAL